MPPWRGALMMVRVRCWVPLPHDLVQVDNALKLLTSHGYGCSHTRSEVAVAAVFSNCPSGHGVTGTHMRSAAACGAAVSYSSTLHSV